jgi:hypothetical protein
MPSRTADGGRNLLGDGYSQDALIDMGELHGTKMSDDDVKVLVKSAEAAYSGRRECGSRGL